MFDRFEDVLIAQPSDYSLFRQKVELCVENEVLIQRYANNPQLLNQERMQKPYQKYVSTDPHIQECMKLQQDWKKLKVMFDENDAKIQELKRILAIKDSGQQMQELKNNFPNIHQAIANDNKYINPGLFNKDSTKKGVINAAINLNLKNFRMTRKSCLDGQEQIAQKIEIEKAKAVKINYLLKSHKEVQQIFSNLSINLNNGGLAMNMAQLDLYRKTFNIKDGLKRTQALNQLSNGDLMVRKLKYICQAFPSKNPQVLEYPYVDMVKNGVPIMYPEHVTESHVSVVAVADDGLEPSISLEESPLFDNSSPALKLLNDNVVAQGFLENEVIGQMALESSGVDGITPGFVEAFDPNKSASKQQALKPAPSLMQSIPEVAPYMDELAIEPSQHHKKQKQGLSQQQQLIEDEQYMDQFLTQGRSSFIIGPDKPEPKVVTIGNDEQEPKVSQSSQLSQVGKQHVQNTVLKSKQAFKQHLLKKTLEARQLGAQGIQNMNKAPVKATGQLPESMRAPKSSNNPGFSK